MSGQREIGVTKLRKGHTEWLRSARPPERLKPACLHVARQRKQAASSHVAKLNSDAILTKRQAAGYVQTTERYLERMAAIGRLRVFKPTGKLWRVRKSDLDAFLESGATIGGGPQ